MFNPCIRNCLRELAQKLENDTSGSYYQELFRFPNASATANLMIPKQQAKFMIFCLSALIRTFISISTIWKAKSMSLTSFFAVLNLLRQIRAISVG